MIVADPERWKRISPLLDGLLDLSDEARAERLATMRLYDPALADELASLIADAARAEEEQFLAGHAGLRADLRGGAMPSLEGTRIGSYVLETPLGQGGAGAVWCARRADGRFVGRVAVKLLHLSLVGRTGALRFEREGAILARLAHPHIARLLDAGVAAGGQPYLVLELVEGERIDRHCDAARLGVGERIRVFREVLDAVAHAHRHLVIHRDIKPSNIMVTADGSVKLLDFGIAKLLSGDDVEAGAADLTVERGGVLTPDYAAPEQLRGEAITTATDVYALGVLLYQLLSGRHPTARPGATPADVMRSTLDADPEPLSGAVATGYDSAGHDVTRIAEERDTTPLRLKRELQGDLENIVAKALKKAPAERYPTVDALADDLRRRDASEPVSARPDSFAYRTTRFVRRHRGAVAAGGLTLVAIVAGLVGTIFEAHRAEQQSELALREAATARRERDESLQQQLLQRGSNEFLQLVLRDAAGGDPGAIRKQLDRATVLIDQTRFEQPIVKVALLRQTAARYAELGDIDATERLLRQAVASIEGTDLAAPTSGVPVNLACSLARLLHEMNDQQGALAEVDRADRLIAAGAQVGLPSRAACRIQRSYVATSLGDHRVAVGILKDTLRQLADAGIREGEQLRVIRSALSMALAAAGDTGAAMAIAKPLLTESEAGQGRESMAVLRRSSVVTGLTRAGGDPLAAEALAEADSALAARLLGGGRVDAAIAFERGRDLLELARFPEAVEAFVASRRAATASKSLIHVLPAGLGETEALLRAGQVEAAADRFGELAPLREAAAAPLRIEAARVAALLAIAEGDAAAAGRALDAAERAVDAAGGPSHPQAFAIAMTRGEALLDGRRADAGALAVADRALAAAQRAALSPDRSSDVGRALLLRARLLAMNGRSDEARRAGAAARAQLAPTLGPTHPETLAASALAG